MRARIAKAVDVVASDGNYFTAISFPLLEGEAGNLTAHCIAFEDATGATVHYLLIAAFKRAVGQGVIREGGLITMFEKRASGTTGANAQLVASGNDATVEVKGILNKTFRWMVYADFFVSIP